MYTVNHLENLKNSQKSIRQWAFQDFNTLPILTSDNTLMVNYCINTCLLPSKTCEALFKNRKKNRDLKEFVGSKQYYYKLFSRQT